jgi:predicted NUDIX family phosphoesterase
MSAVKTEQVMVVKTQLFHQLGAFQGFNSDTEKYLPTLLDPANTDYRPRDQMEEDPSFKQLIPYCIFQFVDPNGNKQVFQYTRGSGGGESRLHAKKSVGIGGHISTEDIGDDCPYELGMQRELAEEIQIDTAYEQSMVGLINDDSNAVGKVHLGVVHLFSVEAPNINSRELEIASAGFSPVEDVLQDIERYETWSQFCLKSLFV